MNIKVILFVYLVLLLHDIVDGRSREPKNKRNVQTEEDLKVPPSASPETEDDIDRGAMIIYNNPQPTEESRRQPPEKNPSNEKSSQPPNTGPSSTHEGNKDTIQDDPLAVKTSKEEKRLRKQERWDERMRKLAEISKPIQAIDDESSEEEDPAQESLKLLDKKFQENPYSIQARDDPLIVLSKKKQFFDNLTQKEREILDKTPHLVDETLNWLSRNLDLKKSSEPGETVRKMEKEEPDTVQSIGQTLGNNPSSDNNTIQAIDNQQLAIESKKERFLHTLTQKAKELWEKNPILFGQLMDFISENLDWKVLDDKPSEEVDPAQEIIRLLDKEFKKNPKPIQDDPLALESRKQLFLDSLSEKERELCEKNPKIFNETYNWLSGI